VKRSAYDAIVVGAGPNGLAAAIVLAQAGRSVLVLEGQPTIGGGTRTAELTIPGFAHDVCSAIHPLAVATSFFQSLPLHEHGLAWIEPPVLLAHPLDDGPPALLHRSLSQTASELGTDGNAYDALWRPLVDHWDALEMDALGPPHLPRHPFRLARFGLAALRSASGLARARFAGERARVLLAGMSAHAAVPLTQIASASFGLVLGAAGHRAGWPIPAGGSQAIGDALASYLRSLGGEIVVDAPVANLNALPPARLILLDVTPRQALTIAGHRFTARARAALERFRYGPGVCKVDWALNAPVPWRDADCARAGTVHVGGGLDAIADAEARVWRDEHPERPFVLLAQPSRFDPSRAPSGQHTLWGYCHVPNGSDVDMTSRIEAQIERFAPGFRDCVIARRSQPAATLASHNASLVGGDIAGGANILSQLFFRPTFRRVPYATSAPGVYFCSSSTPPGGGVHGLCGAYAARAALAFDGSRRR
jgi:phytoene dehydrogenase-like protein